MRAAEGRQSVEPTITGMSDRTSREESVETEND